MDPIGLKIVVLGPAGAGKTCVIKRYCNGTFKPGSMATIGAEFLAHNIEKNGIQYTLLMWDTAGEERFKSVAPCLLHGSDGLILVFDLTSFQSFKGINDYYEMYIETCEIENPTNPPILLLGNKSDIKDLEFVDDAIINSWAKERHIKNFRKVSAKTGEGIAEAIESDLLGTIISTKEAAPSLSICINPPQNNKKEEKGCC